MTNMVTVGLCLTNVPLAFTPHPWSTGSYQHHVLIINRWYDLLVGTERHGSGELHMSYLITHFDRTPALPWLFELREPDGGRVRGPCLTGRR